MKEKIIQTIFFPFCSFSVAFIYSGYRSVIIQLSSGYDPVIVRLSSGYHPVIVQLSSSYCPVIVRLSSGYHPVFRPSPTDSLISLRYSMPVFSANSFRLFLIQTLRLPIDFTAYHTEKLLMLNSLRNYTRTTHFI